jgi:hypothetical protein
LPYADTIFTPHHVFNPRNLYPPLRKLFAYISVSCLIILITSFSWLPATNEQNLVASNAMLHLITDSAQNISEKASSLYDLLNLEKKGLSKEAFDYAYRGYLHLLKKKRIHRPDYLTICDLSQSAKQKRLYLIDIINNKLLLNTYVAHGRNSGGEYATRFSNKPASLQSSLGFYITKNTYTGEHGLSLKVEGLEPGFNDRAYRRAIVVHGATYIGEGSMGRSYGCPAIPKEESNAIINTIKNGTCLFIYHPSKKYLRESKILKG